MHNMCARVLGVLALAAPLAIDGVLEPDLVAAWTGFVTAPRPGGYVLEALIDASGLELAQLSLDLRVLAKLSTGPILLADRRALHEPR